jgi:chaperonin GroEL
MIPKHVFLGKDGHEKLMTGIRKLAGAVKSTLGPSGRTVIMESEHHVGGKVVTKDGVSVAKSINLYDPVENLAISIVKEAANQTATIAGDGTTTSIVLTEAILDAAELNLTPKSNVTAVARHLTTIAEDLTKILTKKSKAVTKRRLLDVATISANNDRQLGKMIADVFKQVNVVSVEMSKTPVTHTEIIDGMKIDRGYTSPVMITNVDRETCELTNPYVLLTDMEIDSLMKLEHVLSPVLANNHSLLIIGNMTPQAQNTLNHNVMAGKIKACQVMPANFGYRSKEMMRDMAAALGAVFYSEELGDGLHNITFEGLGRAAKVVASRDRTILYKHADIDETELDKRVEELKSRISDEMSLSERKDTEARIANLTEGVGVIYVGANSDIEAKEKYDRVDDAVRAVGAAIESGIVPGGGIALVSLSNIIEDNLDDDDYQTAANIMRSALLIPFKQIMINGGLEPIDVYQPIVSKGEPWGYGYNLKTDEYGDMMSMGVIDPTLVTKSALNNAVSVAKTIMTSEAIVVNMREGDV